MAAIMDVLISMLMGGMLLMNIVDAQSIIAEDSSLYRGDVLVQEMLINQVQFMEGEIRNMGYGVPQGVRSITYAGDSSITFLMDANRDGTIDTIRYDLGPVSELSGTPNEMDRFIHRTFISPGGSETGNIGVVTFFHMLYINASGDTLTTPVPQALLGSIKEVELSMEVQNPQALYRPQGTVKSGERNALYSTSYWQQTRLASQNFRR
jgi:hypothetical protein